MFNLGSNQKEMSLSIQSKIEAALNYTIEKMYEALQRHILEDVYYYDYFPNKFYAYGDGFPTMDFLNAFKKTANKKINNGLQGSILYFYQTMRTDSQKGIHVNGTYDLRAELAELLNVDGVFAKKERNLYWDNFIDTVKSHLLEWFEEGFKNG